MSLIYCETCNDYFHAPHSVSYHTKRKQIIRPYVPPKPRSSSPTRFLDEHPYLEFPGLHDTLERLTQELISIALYSDTPLGSLAVGVVVPEKRRRKK